jgi:uncharacterized protein (DUF1015 family)
VPRFEPFYALRYSDQTQLAALCAPPYDVLSDTDRQQLAVQSPHNIVHIDLPVAAPPSDAYANASRTLNEWINDGVLQRDEQRSLTLYRTSFIDTAGKSRNIVGVIGALEVVDEGAGGVLPHEQTTPKAKTDRLDLTRATDCNLSPVWGLSTKIGLSALLAEQGEPMGSVVDSDGVVHSVERIVDAKRIDSICAAVGSDPVVIADGHHRSASSVALKQRKLEEGNSDEVYQYFMALVLSQAQLKILGFHRLVKCVVEFDLNLFLSDLKKIGSLHEVNEQELQLAEGKIGVYAAG